jgi:hypothetical protein
MLRFLKQTVLLAGLIIGCESAFGFALIGPVPGSGNPDSYQVTTIGYGLGSGTFPANGAVSTVGGYGPLPATNGLIPTLLFPSEDMGTPKNIGEGYRRNTPIMYYSFDASFLEFFGPDGAAEVDKAMAMYNSLDNVSSYSPDLSEFPLNSRRLNVRAANDSLLDIRSVTLGLMTEQLGFWQPVRWVWALHERNHTSATGFPPCPGGMEYTVDRRNLALDPSGTTNYVYSSYVNGVLYSYNIIEGCTTLPAADAIEVPVDELDPDVYSAVADYTSQDYNGLIPGVFYTSLTRDDIGGLRYLIRQNNLARETAGARTIEFVTNTAPVAVSTFDLNLFAAQARTNDAAALTALYPGLVDVSSNFFGLQVTTNITATLVNSPLDPAGFPPTHPRFTTNYSTNFVTLFSHSFGNVFTNTFSPRGLIATVTFGLSTSPNSPAGSLPTLTTNVKPAIANGVFGDFFLLPTNVCGVQIISNLLTTVVATTNFPTIIGGGTTGTNGTGTNVAVAFTPGIVTFFTNHIVVYLPVNCPTDPAGTFGGVEKIRFIRRDYDSLINQAWDPVTNDYTVVELTNSTIIPRHMQRAVPRPDFLFTAADLALDFSLTYTNTVAGQTETLSLSQTLGGSIGMYDVIRTINYNQSARPGNNAGPGTIESPLVLPTLMIFNKVGPLYQNNNLFQVGGANSAFLSENTQSPVLNLSWGSFDGTTNAPEVYPNGSSISALEGLLTGPAVTTSGVPTANIGANYSTQLNAQGGQSPYTWSLAPGSPALPAGLNLSPDGQITGTATGPAAIYDFTVRVTDSTGAFRDIAFALTVS